MGKSTKVIITVVTGHVRKETINVNKLYLDNY